MASRAKRLRTSNPNSDGAASDGEGEVKGTLEVGAAERKRELERNRRNLVNTRFAELEAQLARLPGAPKRVYRRIDKEVVLKDATQALASQQRDLELSNNRLTTMTAEITTLRSEKLELRQDKSYLHKELANARAENRTIAADNMLLWQALVKAGAVKSSLPTEISKVPVNVVFGSENTSTDTMPTCSSQQPPSSNSIPDFTPVDMFKGLDLEQSTHLTSPQTGSGDAGHTATNECDEFLKVSEGFNAGQPNSILAQFALDLPYQRSGTSNNAHPDIAPCG